jgi:hypothetical protein
MPAFMDHQVAGIEQREVAAFLADRIPQEKDEEEQPSDGFGLRQHLPLRCPHFGDIGAKIAKPLDHFAHS